MNGFPSRVAPRLVVFGVLAVLLAGPALAQDNKTEAKVPRIAAIVSEYRPNSHADVIVGRILQTDTLDGKGKSPKLELVSVYTDQVPKSDTSRALAKEHGFKIYDSVAEALTLGTDKLAVDGVLLIIEHGDYPLSDIGQKMYPKRKLFGQIVEVFKQSGRVVPVYNDKHLSDTWEDTRWVYDTAREMKIPMMAGSSLPSAWRYAPTDLERDRPVKELVVLNYGGLSAYGFHALEAAQALVERRKGGETGVKSVQSFDGDAVWEAIDKGICDRELLMTALLRQRQRPLPTKKKLEEFVRNPTLFVIDYNDGLRVNVASLHRAVYEWAAAWRYADDGHVDSTLLWTQDGRPYMHFTILLQGIEKMFHTGKPTWPVERTLLTSGTLTAVLTSRRDGGKLLKTPHLDISYSTEWNWKQPPPPPPVQPRIKR